MARPRSSLRVPFRYAWSDWRGQCVAAWTVISVRRQDGVMTRLSGVLVCLGFALLLHGCAAHKPVPEGYTGPVALISDSGYSEDGTKAQVFALMEVDEKPIENSFGASARASHGQGFALTTRFVSRPVPATPMKVKL